MESMGVASGCDCNELYKFPHYFSLLLVYLLFLAASSLLLVHFQKMFCSL